MSAWRDRIRIKGATAKQPAALGPQVLEETVGTYWCNVRVLSAEKRLAYQQAGYGDVTHELRFRSAVPLVMKDRIYIWATNGDAELIPAGPPVDASMRGRFRTILVKETRPSEV